MHPMANNRITVNQYRQYLKSGNQDALKAQKTNPKEFKLEKGKQVVHDGIKFKSIMEGDHYLKLKLLQQSGVIKELNCEPIYRFKINNVSLGYYKPDFSFYRIKPNGIDWEFVVQDKKGRNGKGNQNPMWRIFRMKVKLMKALFNIDVEVV